MPYECTTDLNRVAEFLRGAPAVAFDFETAPLPAFRTDARAALDAHSARVGGGWRGVFASPVVLRVCAIRVGTDGPIHGGRPKRPRPDR
jgi:hypothetical protein